MKTTGYLRFHQRIARGVSLGTTTRVSPGAVLLFTIVLPLVLFLLQVVL